MKKTVNTLINLSLLALALLALVSCDNASSVPGGLVTMKIDFRGMEAGSSEDLRSASSEIVSTQRIVLPSGEEWQVDLRIDPESPLRATTLASTSYIRLLAINSGNLVGYVDWQQGSTVPDLSIPSSYSTCDFICYSYNNSNNTLPSGYTSGSSLDPLTVRDVNSKELLLWRASGVTISDGGSVGPVTLTRQLTQVKLKLDCSGDGKTITGVSPTTPITITSGYTGGTTYNLAGGGLVTAVSSFDEPFTWLTSTFGGTTVTSDTLTLVPQPGFTLTIPANAITLQTGVTQNTLTEIPFLTSQLAAGKTHTILVRLVKSFAKFASSNIYWDGTKLTFDEYSSSPSLASSQKQGVLFKWGSLIGLSAPGKAGVQKYNWSNDSTIYVPLNPGSPTTNHTAWEQTTTTDAQSAWTSSGTDYVGIPFVAADEYTGPSDVTLARADNYLTTLTLESSYKGDICKYINSSYRMPMSKEFDDVGYWSGQADIPHYNTTNAHLLSDIDGTTQFANAGSVNRGVTLTTPTTGIGGLFFPASGCRDTGGNLFYVGLVAYYWSSSASPLPFLAAYHLYFSYGTLLPAVVFSRSAGHSVRCVLQ